MANLEIDHSLATKIFNRYDLGEVGKITEIKGGLINPAYLINGLYVLRLENQQYETIPDKFKKEAYLFSVLSQYGVPTPEIIGFDDSGSLLSYPFMLLKHIPGDTLTNSFINLNAIQQRQVAYDLGNLARKIHSITPTIIGNQPLLGKADYWLMNNINDFNKYWQVVKNSEYLSDKEVHAINRAQLQFQQLNLTNFGRLVHGDFSAGNIQIQAGKIVGVFDFEYSFFADPLWDLQKLPINFQLGTGFDHQAFLQGYGITKLSSEEKIRLKRYCLHQGIWEIWATITQFMPFGTKELEEGKQLISNTLTYDLLN